MDASVRSFYLFLSLGSRRKNAEILLAGDGNVCSIDATAGVHILSEVRRANSLKILLPDQRNVAPIDTTADVDVAHQHAHGHGEGSPCCRQPCQSHQSR